MSIACTSQSLIDLSTCYDCIPEGMQPAVHTYLLCQWSQGAGAVCDDPVVIDWLQRLADDFQPMPSLGTIRAVCDFCTALRLSGLMDKMLVVNPIIPDSFLAMRYPLIYQAGNGNSPFTNFNFVAANLDNDGLVGDRGVTDQYMNTGFNPTTHWGLDTETAGLSLYESESTAVPGNEVCIGANDDTLGHALEITVWDALVGGGYGLCWNDPGSFLGFGLGADIPSFYTVNRVSNVLFRAHQGNSGGFNLLNTNIADQSVESPVNLQLYFMAYNLRSVGADAFVGKRISFMAIHEGLLPAEANDLFDAVQTLRMQLGGGWV